MEDELRSMRSDERCFVRFVNWTNRTVEIIWLNFTGAYVKYQEIESGRFVDINTYKTHPWIALDQKTKDRLHIGKQFTHFPKTTMEYFRERYAESGRNLQLPNDYEARIRVIITLPLYSLRFRALLAVRDLISVEDTEKLELPKELREDLRKVFRQPSLTYLNY